MSEVGLVRGDPFFFQSLLEECDSAVFRAIYFHPSNCTVEDQAIFANAWAQHVCLWEQEKHDLIVLIKIPKFAASLQKAVFDLERISSQSKRSLKQTESLLETVSCILLPVLVEKDLADDEVHIFQKSWEIERGIPEGYCSPLVQAVPILCLRTSYIKWSIRSHLKNLQFVSHQSYLKDFTLILKDILGLLSESGREFAYFVKLCQELPVPPMLKDRV